ncbi:hypothetical protein GGI15_001568 [Coemansia interrupta]|uniref:BZIP domain-containing protein n=1 Tax=Coemansia interrupta TaxID=1126814 RepID=A0A9W8HJR8_9FUNG|nr:hypothetical protein GGI15_001568 [Coemansia interrupta]
MPRPTAASAPASPAVSNNNNTALNKNIKKSQTMDKLFSIVNSTAQSVPPFAHHDDRNPYIMPSFADNFEAWAYPESQQAVFEDWIATTATPPSTANASPSMTQNMMLAAATAAGVHAFPISPLTMSPTLSPPSSNLSTTSSPLISNDISFSLASTLQNAVVAPAPTPASESRMSSGSFSVADYAAVLFPDIAASLSGALMPQTPAIVPELCNSSTDLKRAFSDVSIHHPTVASPAAESTSGWPAELAGLFEAATATSTAAAATTVAAPVDAEAEELRKRRDTEFLASLPPQLALKRRRTSNTKQKEKILAEIMSEAGAPPTKKAATTAAKKAVAAPLPVAVPAPAAVVHADAAADEEHADDEPVDAAALKRRKNTDAARRSRMRKILRIETLEGRVSELETENNKLSQMVAALEAEKAAMAQRMAQMEGGQLQAASFAL